MVFVEHGKRSVMKTDQDSSFADRLSAAATEMTNHLGKVLDGRSAMAGAAWPARLNAAMRHGVLNGGKRLRPFLVLETASMLGGNRQDALMAASALECIHCYSLIHDDLPAMDDDSLRRGQPTVHVAFDEATAILAGDALLTLAFELLGNEEGSLSAKARLDLIKRLARASGAGGMVGGQMLDLAAERETFDEARVMEMQAMKTGALLRHACVAGAIVSQGDGPTLERMERFGALVGLAFQLADDVLDVTANADTIGKATGKDASRGKATFVALHGVEAARAKCRSLVVEAEDVLAPFGAKSAILVEAARYIAERDR